MNDKKWFFYLDDHHEGPFTVSEIQQKMSDGLVARGSYVWCEGMPDWKQITEIPAFEEILGHQLKIAITQGSSASQFIAVDDSAITREIKMDPQTNSQVTNVPDLALAGTDEAPLNPDSQYESQSQAPNVAVKTKRNSLFGRLAFWVWTLFLAASGGGYFLYQSGKLAEFSKNSFVQSTLQSAQGWIEPYTMAAMDQFPILSEWLSPLGPIDDVSSEDLSALKRGALLTEDKKFQIGFAVSTQDPARPSFYVTSHLPEGTVFDIYVEGDGDSLLNRLSFSQKTSAMLMKRIGKTAPMSLPDQLPIPQGEYQIWISEANGQPEATQKILQSLPATNQKFEAVQGKKLVSRHRLFLGGKNDPTYQARLKDFHDKIKEKAGSELIELRQFESTLRSLLSEAQGEFEKIKKIKSVKVRSKEWETFDQKWSASLEQIKTSASHWTPEVLENEIFYGAVYKLVLAVIESVAKVHQEQIGYFKGTDKKVFEIQYGSAVATGQSTLDAFKLKIEQAEKLGTSARGVPQREGL